MQDLEEGGRLPQPWCPASVVPAGDSGVNPGAGPPLWCHQHPPKKDKQGVPPHTSVGPALCSLSGFSLTCKRIIWSGVHLANPVRISRAWRSSFLLLLVLQSGPTSAGPGPGWGCWCVAGSPLTTGSLHSGASLCRNTNTVFHTVTP